MLYRDDVPDEAAEALTASDRSRTARVFAAAAALEGTECTIQALFEWYACRQARHVFEPSPSLRRDLRQFCRVAHEQGLVVDAETVLAAAVPEERTTVLRRGRAIRSSRALGPRERDRRLRDFLDAAREAGFDVDRAALNDYDPPDPRDNTTPTAEPPPTDQDALDRLLLSVETNVVTDGEW